MCWLRSNVHFHFLADIVTQEDITFRLDILFTNFLLEELSNTISSIALELDKSMRRLGKECGAKHKKAVLEEAGINCKL